VYSRLTLIDSLDVDKSFSSLGNIVADAVGIKTSVKVITGTKEIGQVIYTETPPSGTTFAITGGADKDLFTINESTGALSFTSVMLFQSPLDFDRNGIYEVIITATEDDGTVNTGNLGVEVSLDNTLPEFKDTTITYTVNDDGATVIKLTGKLIDDLSGMV